MKKILFTILLLSVSSLFGETYGVQAKPKVLVVPPDEIEVLVTGLLGERKSPSVTYQKKDVSSVPKGKYFVQMSAYSTSKPVALIEKIRQRGYNIKSHKAWRNNQQVNLLLVGPYNSRKDISPYLSDLKSMVEGAFIYKAQ